MCFRTLPYWWNEAATQFDPRYSWFRFRGRHPEFVNTKLVRNAIGRSTLRLKGNSCNGGNSENYINARNRKVYTMIELHGVGLLAEGQSASHWRLRILFASYVSQAAVPAYFFFSVLCRNDRIFGGLLFLNGFQLRYAKKKHSRYNVFGKSMLLVPSLTGSQGDASQTNFWRIFSFRYARMRWKEPIDVYSFR